MHDSLIQELPPGLTNVEFKPLQIHATVMELPLEDFIWSDLPDLLNVNGGRSVRSP